MSKFEAIDPDQPATLENVLTAVMRLRDHDEAALAELVSAGRLRELFPFRSRSGELPPDSAAEEDVPEASARPLSDTEYRKLVQSSMRADTPPKLVGRTYRVTMGSKLVATRTAQASARGLMGMALKKIRTAQDRVGLKRSLVKRKLLDSKK